MNYSPVNFKRNIRIRGADLLHELKRPPQNMHGIIGYIFVFFTGFADYFFQINGGLCRITCALAAVRLFITLVTDFKPAAVKIISFRIHGLIEIAVASALLALRFCKNGKKSAFYFYAAFTCVILLVFIFTDFAPVRLAK